MKMADFEENHVLRVFCHRRWDTRCDDGVVYVAYFAELRETNLAAEENSLFLFVTTLAAARNGCRLSVPESLPLHRPHIYTSTILQCLSNSARR